MKQTMLNRAKHLGVLLVPPWLTLGLCTVLFLLIGCATTGERLVKARMVCPKCGATGTSVLVKRSVETTGRQTYQHSLFRCTACREYWVRNRTLKIVDEKTGAVTTFTIPKGAVYPAP